MWLGLRQSDEVLKKKTDPSFPPLGKRDSSSTLPLDLACFSLVLLPTLQTTYLPASTIM